MKEGVRPNVWGAVIEELDKHTLAEEIGHAITRMERDLPAQTNREVVLIVHDFLGAEDQQTIPKVLDNGGGWAKEHPQANKCCGPVALQLLKGVSGPTGTLGVVLLSTKFQVFTTTFSCGLKKNQKTQKSKNVAFLF